MPVKTKKTPFSRLSAAQKRIAIAEDILKQIRADQYDIQQGTWLSVDEPEYNVEDLINKLKENNQLNSPSQSLLTGVRGVIELPSATCTCCAVGAACASAIRLFNNDELKNNQIDSYGDGSRILRKYFPQAQIDMIEAAFEMRDDTMHKAATPGELNRAVEFGEELEDDHLRAEAIFKNIIKNKGTFKP